MTAPTWVVELRDVASVLVPFGDYTLSITYDCDEWAHVEVYQGEHGDWDPVATGRMPWGGILAGFGLALANIGHSEIEHA